MAKNIEIIKGNHYVCIKDVKVPSGYGVYCHKGGIYTSPEDGYLVHDTGNQFKPYEWTLSEYFRPATAEEIVIGRALTEEQQLLVKELKLKIELAKIEFVKCGLSEHEAIKEVEQLIKKCIQEIYHPKFPTPTKN